MRAEAMFQHVLRLLFVTTGAGCITVQVPPCPCAQPSPAGASSAVTSIARPSTPPVTLDPARWWKAGHDPSFYSWTKEDATAQGGRNTMRLEQKAGAPSSADLWAATGGAVSAVNYRGLRIRLTADVKTQDASVGASVWLRLDDVSGTSKLCNMIDPVDHRLKGTSDFTPLSCVLDVPDTTKNIAYGLILSGPGSAWIGPATLETVGMDVAETPHV